MLINAIDPEESRIAVVEDGVLQELHVEIANREAYLGNIYKGKVVNIEPSIGAAFVNFGGRTNGFLHVSDVLPAYSRDDFRLSDVIEGRAKVLGDDGPDVVRSVLDDDEDGQGEDASATNEDDASDGDRKRGRARRGRTRGRGAVDDDPSAEGVDEDGSEAGDEDTEDLDRSYAEHRTEDDEAAADAGPDEEEDSLDQDEAPAPRRRSPRSRSRRRNGSALDRGASDVDEPDRDDLTRGDSVGEDPGDSDPDEAPPPAESASTAIDDEDQDEALPPKPKARRPRRRRAASTEDESGSGDAFGVGADHSDSGSSGAGTDGDGDEPGASDGSDDDDGDPEPRVRVRRATRRRAPRRRAPEGDESGDEDVDAPAAAATQDDDFAEEREPRRRRRATRSEASERDADDGNFADAADSDGEAAGDRAAGDGAEASAAPRSDDDDEGDGGPRRRRRSRRTRSAREEQGEEAEEAPRSDAKRSSRRGGSRRGDAKDKDGDSARPAAKKARGGRRAGPNKPPRPRTPIDQLIKKGQEVVVQVTKEGIGTKGPTLTTFISLPGRSLVLMPSLPKCGVSRKIEDERERRRLKKIVRELDQTGNGGIGFIVRTAGIDKTGQDLQRDRDYLNKIFEMIGQRLPATRAPALLYEESDLVLKAMRDLFVPDIDEVVVDSEDVYMRVRDFAEKLMPQMADRIRLHEAKTPLFHQFGIETDLEALYEPKVELRNGGSIVIDQTEALVAIDINSGKFKPGSDLEETAYRTNLEAIPEVIRQLRLRDLGGVIIIDFIDMSQERHRRAIQHKLIAGLKGDRARIKVGRISPFGTLEMTRQRVGPGLKHTVFMTCTHCHGTGLSRTVQSKALTVLREARALVHLKGFSILQVYLSPAVNDWLVNFKRRQILDLEDAVGKRLVFKAEPSYPTDAVHYRFLTGDGQQAKVHIPPGLGIKP